MTDVVDPRPVTTETAHGVVVRGGRCVGCDLRTLVDSEVCPDCGGELADASYGPGGTVVASTVLRVGVPGHPPPYAVAYVVLDDGPRVLAHTRGESPTRLGSRVVLSGTDAAGDVTVRPEEG